jgi:8-oxo-dGTP diphosphatase
MFDYTLNKVVLIRKDRPEWQKGKLNGVGGKVEENESPYDAMPREFREETGIETSGWKLFSILCFGDIGIPGSLSEVYCYWILGDVSKPRSVTSEQIVVINVESLTSREDAIPNIRWLVQMARSMSLGETATYFDIYERKVWQN